VIVGSADEEHLVAKLPAKARMNVGRQERSDQVAEMLDAIHIWNGAGDQDFRHEAHPLRRSMSAAPEKPTKKALPQRTEGLGFGARRV
jgi:hypothetical protein